MSVSIKRSRHLRLVLMAAAVPALAACDSEPSGRVMTSLEECKTQTEVSVAECEAGYQKAQAEHQRLAPRFDSQLQCNDQFGACQPLQDSNTGSQSWVPPMTGFLLGYAVSEVIDEIGDARKRKDCKRYDATGRATNHCNNYRVSGYVPLYRDYRSGDFIKPDGKSAGDRGGLVKGKVGNTSLPTRAITVSRSGFGSSASARGGFGSSRSSGG